MCSHVPACAYGEKVGCEREGHGEKDSFGRFIHVYMDV